MNDLFVAIKVDPGQSAQNADKVTAALHRTEDAGERAQKAITRGLRQIGNEAQDASLGMSKLARAVETANKPLERADALARQTGESTKILNERIRDVGKGAAFAMAAQGFAALKKGLDDVTASAASAAAEGAAVGATFGGPFGAAIGVAAGAIKGLVIGLRDSEAAMRKQRREAEKTAEAYWEQVRAIERRQRVEKGLADIVRQSAESEKQDAEARATQNRILNESAERYRRLTDEISAYEGRLVEAREAMRQGGGGIAEAELRAAERGLRNARLELEALERGGSEAWLEAKRRENERLDRLHDLEIALGQQGLAQSTYNRLLGEYNELLKTEADGTKKVIELRKALFGGHAFLSLEPVPRNTTDVFSGPRSVTSGIAAPEDFTAGLIAREQAKSVDYLTEAWHREIEANEKAVAAAEKLGKAFQPAKEAMLDFIRTGDISAERLLDTLTDISLKLLEMSALQAITGNVGGSAGGFLAGLLGGRTGFDHLVSSRPGVELPGFARGGDVLVGGSGAPDSKLAMFRVTPGESIHVRTPQQRAAEREAVASPVVRVTNVVQVQNDPREVTRAIGTRSGKREVIEINREFNRRR